MINEYGCQFLIGMVLKPELKAMDENLLKRLSVNSS